MSLSCEMTRRLADWGWWFRKEKTPPAARRRGWNPVDPRTPATAR